ncbi:MAG TPA: hypothetical protein VGI80_08375 [Pyrinomonadaceae bacterium]|jgi:hypothetical protein
MRPAIYVQLLTLLLYGMCLGQQQDAPPVSIASPLWHVDHRQRPTQDNSSTHPHREMNASDKYYAREKRNNDVHPGTPDPNETTADGAREKMDKAEDEARSSGGDDEAGFLYRASFTNNTKKTVSIIFWEYRFTELANPANVVRRQFLCSANMKPAAKKDLWIFTPLGPSESISADSLTKTVQPLFDEKIYINRIEFTDDSILQRGGWKLEDVKKGVDSATSTPWGNEVCRAI